MYGTRFKRRAVSRPESMIGGRSRRRLLVRPAAYAVLAAAVCLAAATLPSSGKNDTAKAAPGPWAAVSPLRPPTWHSSSSRSSRRAALARFRRAPIRDPVNPESDRRPGLLPVDGRPDADQVPDILTAYGLRTVDGSCNNLKAGENSPPPTSRFRG